MLTKISSNSFFFLTFSLQGCVGANKAHIDDDDIDGEISLIGVTYKRRKLCMELPPPPPPLEDYWITKGSCNGNGGRSRGGRKSSPDLHALLIHLSSSSFYTSSPPQPPFSASSSSSPLSRVATWTRNRPIVNFGRKLFRSADAKGDDELSAKLLHLRLYKLSQGMQSLVLFTPPGNPAQLLCIIPYLPLHPPPTHRREDG